MYAQLTSIEVGSLKKCLIISLKKINHNYDHQYTPLQREACSLQQIQQFHWSPRLICQRHDYLLTSYMGEPLCKHNLPKNYVYQIQQIGRDIKSINMRHNDMSKPYTNDFVVSKGRIALVDWGWATFQGNLKTECIVHGVQLYANDIRPYNKNINNGFGNKNETKKITIPECKSYKKKLKFQQLQRAGSQSENPKMIFKMNSTSVSGYQKFTIRSDNL